MFWLWCYADSALHWTLWPLHFWRGRDGRWELVMYAEAVLAKLTLLTAPKQVDGNWCRLSHKE